MGGAKEGLRETVLLGGGTPLLHLMMGMALELCPCNTIISSIVKHTHTQNRLIDISEDLSKGDSRN